MNTSITVRLFCAVFLTIFGIALIFVRTEQGLLLVGSLTAAAGITFLTRMGLALRKQ